MYLTTRFISVREPRLCDGFSPQQFAHAHLSRGEGPPALRVAGGSEVALVDGDEDRIFEEELS